MTDPELDVLAKLLGEVGRYFEELRRQLAEANQRADAAEAAAYERACEVITEIPADCLTLAGIGIPNTFAEGTSASYEAVASLATDNRPALDALLRAEREKALREAGKIAGNKALSSKETQAAILALIDKEPTND